jgi:hypothetical protein
MNILSRFALSSTGILRIYQKKIKELEGDLHPHIVDKVTDEASAIKTFYDECEVLVEACFYEQLNNRVKLMAMEQENKELKRWLAKIIKDGDSEQMNELTKLLCK